MIEAVVLVLFPMLVAFAGASDLLTMKIGNRVSILLIIGFIVLAAVNGMPVNDWGMHGLGLVVVFLPCFAFFAAGWMGGGDVKLISSVGLWFGFGPILIDFLFLVALLGCVLTLSLVVIRSSWWFCLPPSEDRSGRFVCMTQKAGSLMESRFLLLHLLFIQGLTGSR
jgi:prepilin peptidase CpaA